MYYVMFEMFCYKLVSSCEDTHTKVQAAIKQSENNNSTGPDKVNIGPLGLASHQHVQHITKQQHHPSHMETSKHHTNSKTKQRHEQRHIIQTHLTSLSDSKTMEKALLPYITNNIPHISTQHGFKSNHYKHITIQHHRNRL